MGKYGGVMFTMLSIQDYGLFSMCVCFDPGSPHQGLGHTGMSRRFRAKHRCSKWLHAAYSPTRRARRLDAVPQPVPAAHSSTLFAAIVSVYPEMCRARVGGADARTSCCLLSLPSSITFALEKPRALYSRRRKCTCCTCPTASLVDMDPSVAPRCTKRQSRNS